MRMHALIHPFFVRKKGDILKQYLGHKLIIYITKKFSKRKEVKEIKEYIRKERKEEKRKFFGGGDTRGSR